MTSREFPYVKHFPRDYVPQTLKRDKSFVHRAAKNVTEAPVWNNVIASKIVRQFSRVLFLSVLKNEHRIFQIEFTPASENKTFANTTKVT